MQTSLYPLVARDCITIPDHPPVVLLQYHEDHVEPFSGHVIISDVLGQCFETFSTAGELLAQIGGRTGLHWFVFGQASNQQGVETSDQNCGLVWCNYLT